MVFFSSFFLKVMSVLAIVVGCVHFCFSYFRSLYILLTVVSSSMTSRNNYSICKMRAQTKRVERRNQ